MVKYYTYLELYLGDLNKPISLSEFENHFKKPHQTIKSYLNKFVTAKILKEEKKNRFLFYKLNTKNPLTKEYLLLCEKERLLDFLEKNILFSRLYQELSQFFYNSKIILFGSSTVGENYNDIDLLVISKNKKIKAVLNKFEQTYSKKIHLIQTEKKYLSTTLIQEIKRKHVVFNAHEYFMGVLYDDY